MRGLIGAMAMSMVLFSCQESETVSEFTGNEATYELQQASQFVVSGTVTFKEKKNGTSIILVKLSGTDGDVKLPVHLHLGDISTPGAEIAALLNPVIGRTGESETHLVQLADESSISFQDLIKLEASIKIHLSDIGPERDVILAGGNIGSIGTNGLGSGRSGIGICESQ